MIPELTKLIDLYINNKNKVTFNTDNSEVVEFDDKVDADYITSISMNKIENLYYIFIFVEKDSKIIFKGIYLKGKNELKESYENLKQDLKDFSFEKFIKMYSKILEDNFS